MKTKNIFLILLLYLAGLTATGQITPPSYIYGDPLPTSGDTPHTQIRLTQALVPIAFDDERPVVWDDFLGGGLRSVGTTNERNAIVSGRRKEGMMVWVKDIGLGADQSGLYVLLNGLDNTNWYKLANVTTTNGFEIPSMLSVNIYNQDGELTGDRQLSGVGTHSLTLGGLTQFNVAADQANINGTATSVLGIDSLTLASITALQLSAPSIYLASSNVLNTNAVSGWVWTVIDPQSGYGDWMLAPNLANADLTQTTNRTYDGDGHDLTFQNLNSINLNQQDGSYLQLAPSVTLAEATGASYVLLTPNETTLGSYGTNGLRLITPTVQATTATAGQVLTLIDGSGIADFATITGGGTNVFNITYTTNYVNDNFANANLTATGNRTHDWDGNQLSIVNIAQLYAYANEIGLYVDGGSHGLEFYAGGQSYLYSTNFYLQTSNGFGTPGQVLTSISGNGTEWADPPAGPNFATADLTLTGDRTHDGDGNDVTFNNFDNYFVNVTDSFQVEAANVVQIAGEGEVFIQSDDDVTVYLTGGPASGSGLFLGAGGTTLSGSATISDSMSLLTYNVLNNTATAGQLLALSSTNGVVEFVDPSASQNIMNSDLTSDANHTQNGDGWDMTFENFDDFNLGGFGELNAQFENNMLIESTDASLRLIGFDSVLMQARSADPGPSFYVDWTKLVIDSTNKSLYIKTSGVNSNTVSVGDFLRLSNTNGLVEFADPTSIPGFGQNIMNSDLTADNDHTQDGDGNNLTFQNFLSLNLNTASGSYIQVAPTVSVSEGTGVSYLTLGPNDLTVGAYGTNGLRLITPAVQATTATVGQALRLTSTDGLAEFSTVPTLYTADGTLLGSRQVDGNQFALDLVNMNNVTIEPRGHDFIAGSTLGSTNDTRRASLNAGLVRLNGTTNVTINEYNIGSPGLNPAGVIFAASPSAPASAAQILFRDPTTHIVNWGSTYTAGAIFPKSGVPTIAAGAGAGTSPTVSLTNPNDSAFALNVTTGSSPSASANIAVVTFATAYATAPHVVFSPGNAAAATLSGTSSVWATASTTAVTLHSNTTGLAGSTSYVWQVVVVK